MSAFSIYDDKDKILRMFFGGQITMIARSREGTDVYTTDGRATHINVPIEEVVTSLGMVHVRRKVPVQ